MKSQRILGALSVCVIAASVFAQVVPLCCRYIYDWPNGPGDQGPSGACSGNHARVCESGSNSADSTDPMSMAWNRSKSPRWVQCCTWDLRNGAYIHALLVRYPPCSGCNADRTALERNLLLGC